MVSSHRTLVKRKVNHEVLVEVVVLITWIAFFCQLLLLFLFKSLLVETDVVVVYIIGFTSIFVVARILRCHRSIQAYLVVGYILRLSALFFDVYFRYLYLLPHSGNDSEGFFNSAVSIATNPFLLKEGIYGGFYSKLLGIVYLVTLPNRLLGQFLNVLFGMTIIFVVLRILQMLEIDMGIQKTTMMLTCLFPHSIIFSGILLRENIITMIVIASIYFLIKWTLTNSILDAIKAVLVLLIASAFHAGVIGLIAGYAFLFMFYSPRSETFSFRPRTVSAFILMIVVSMVVYLQFGSMFLAKFQVVDEISTIYAVASGGRGGSVYLTNLRIDTLWQLLLYAPIKMFYFLVVPLPHYWRGLNDVVSFALDGTIYLYFLIYLIKHRRTIVHSPIAVGLMIALLGATFVFGVSVSNAGTALRHRHKIYPVFLIIVALIRQRERIAYKCIRE